MYSEKEPSADTHQPNRHGPLRLEGSSDAGSSHCGWGWLSPPFEGPGEEACAPGFGCGLSLDCPCYIARLRCMRGMPRRIRGDAGPRHRQAKKPALRNFLLSVGIRFRRNCMVSAPSLAMAQVSKGRPSGALRPCDGPDLMIVELQTRKRPFTCCREFAGPPGWMQIALGHFS